MVLAAWFEGRHLPLILRRASCVHNVPCPSINEPIPFVIMPKSVASGRRVAIADQIEIIFQQSCPMIVSHGDHSKAGSMKSAPTPERRWIKASRSACYHRLSQQVHLVWTCVGSSFLLAKATLCSGRRSCISPVAG